MGLFDFAKKVIKDVKKNGGKMPKRTVKRKKTKKKVVKKVQKKTVRKVKKTPRKTVKKPSKAVKRPAKAVKEKEIGVITHYFGKISVGIIKLKASLAVGEKIHIKGAHDDFHQVIKSMQLNHKDITRASKGAEIGIIVKEKVHENDRVYLVRKG